MRTMEKHSSGLSYLWGGGTFFGGALTFNDVLMLIGAVTSLGTFLVNWYYKAKEDKRNASRCRD